MALEQGAALAAVDEPINNQNVRPPGKRKKPVSHHLYACKQETLGNYQYAEPKPTVEGKAIIVRQSSHPYSVLYSQIADQNNEGFSVQVSVFRDKYEGSILGVLFFLLTPDT